MKLGQRIPRYWSRHDEAGYVVCLVDGALAPFTLRRRGELDEFELVGEIYLHGFMAGEALTAEPEA